MAQFLSVCYCSMISARQYVQARAMFAGAHAAAHPSSCSPVLPSQPTIASAALGLPLRLPEIDVISVNDPHSLEELAAITRASGAEAKRAAAAESRSDPPAVQLIFFYCLAAMQKPSSGNFMFL